VGVEQCTGIAEASAKTIHIYPNPASEYITVDAGDISDMITIQLFDIMGRMIFSQASFDNLTTINLSQFSSGSYFLRIEANNSTYTAKQFIIRRD
jgi:hypothetical protein